MNAETQAQVNETTPVAHDRYATCIEVSRRIRWDIDADVIRGREFDFSQTFLPDGLSLLHEVDYLSPDERRLMSQIQGRTYANTFGLVERFIGAKVLELSRDHWLGDQAALEALVRFSDEELKHQELFRRIDRLVESGMPAGYHYPAEPNAVAAAVLGKGSWAVLALTCHIELFTQAHYKESIAHDASLSPLYKDVFLFHWREESQHAILDELEWRREHARLSPEERDRGVDEFIELVGAVDGILQQQAVLDADYFASICGRDLGEAERRRLAGDTLRAYRWQYILSGAQQPRFAGILTELTTDAQLARVQDALAPLMH